MGYKVVAKAGPLDGAADGHCVTTRWRSDDPWGAIWRCLYDCMHGYIPFPPLLEDHGIAQIHLVLSFEVDNEDFHSAIFPADPLDQHRLNPKQKRNSQHGKIPQS